MKKLFYLLICSLAFVGCEREFDSVKFKGRNLAGYWALVEDDLDGVKHYDRPTYMICFDGDDFSDWYCKNEEGYRFEDGYFYGCTINDFETEGDFDLSIKGSSLFVMNMFMGSLSFERGLLRIGYDYNYELYERVKGFK